jgi:hypothetical protein
MPSGGRRPGAGRKKGSQDRPKDEIDRERAFAAMRKAANQAKREEREQAAAARFAERQKRTQARVERAQVEVLPPIDPPEIAPDIGPLEFIETLMRTPGLPLLFRRDCAALALPFRAVKPILGLKDARRLAAFDDDTADEDDDEIAAVLRGR